MPALTTICLPARALFEISDAAGVRIVCTAGCLWLTLDHDTRDVILQPGESFEVAEPRRALLYAFEASAFALADHASQRVRRGPSDPHLDTLRPPVVWAATRTASAA
jgi:hypothetical protein